MNDLPAQPQAFLLKALGASQRGLTLLRPSNWINATLFPKAGWGTEGFCHTAQDVEEAGYLKDVSTIDKAECDR